MNEKLNQRRRERYSNDSEYRKTRLEAGRKWYVENPEKQQQKSERRRKKGPEYRYNESLKMKYGITLVDVHTMKAKQNNRCAICKKEKTLVVDHCHMSGKVRELLCRRCNTFLGFIEAGLYDPANQYVQTHAKNNFSTRTTNTNVETKEIIWR